MQKTVVKQNKTDKPWLFPKGVTGNPNGRPKMTEEEKMIKRFAKQKIVSYLENNGIGAASRIVKLSKKAANEKVLLSANQDILDRIGVGANNKIGIAVQVNIDNKREEYV